jgi:hypothetical protein
LPLQFGIFDVEIAFHHRVIIVGGSRIAAIALEETQIGGESASQSLPYADDHRPSTMRTRGTAT